MPRKICSLYVEWSLIRNTWPHVELWLCPAWGLQLLVWCIILANEYALELMMSIVNPATHNINFLSYVLVC